MFISQLLGEACSSVLGIDALKAMRLNMLEIPPEDLDLIVLSHLQQNRINSNVTKKTSSHTQASARKRASMIFFSGQTVCRNTYSFIYGLGEKRFKNFCTHVKVVHQLKTRFYFLVQYTSKGVNFTHLSHNAITLYMIYSK